MMTRDNRRFSSVKSALEIRLKKPVLKESGGYRFRRIPPENLNSHNFQTKGIRRRIKSPSRIYPPAGSAGFPLFESGGSISFRRIYPPDYKNLSN
jgi:hypothetical protein